MKTKSKFILRLRKGSDLSLEERHQMVQEVLTTGAKKIDVWRKYTGQEEEHGQLLQWMRKFGYVTQEPRSFRFVTNSFDMKKAKTIKHNSEESFETYQLKKRIEELELQVKEAQLKAIAFSTMVDIAEKEFKISIRKKYNTKP